MTPVRTAGTVTPAIIDTLAYVEAVPHYTAIRIRMAVSGTREKTVSGDTTTQTLAYEYEEAFTRIPLAFTGTASSGAEGGIDGIDDLTATDRAFYAAPEGTDCYMLATVEAFANGRMSPAYQTLQIILPEAPEAVEASIGTQTSPAGTITLKTTTNWTAIAPALYHSSAPPSGEFPLVDKWGTNLFRAFSGLGPYLGDITASANIAVSSLSAADWRDLRGTHTVTIADPDSANWDSSDVQYTYEWEIT
jgi:hypothetical protein